MSIDSDNSQPATILILDDEEMVLTSLSSFLELETDYNVITFTEGLKGHRLH